MKILDRMTLKLGKDIKILKNMDHSFSLSLSLSLNKVLALQHTDWNDQINYNVRKHSKHCL